MTESGNSHQHPLPSSQQINQWRQAFVSLNQARLDQARSLLSERQRRVLDILPVLFHINHPKLPGFVSNEAPAGIELYTPQPDAMSAIRYIAKGIQLPRVSTRRSLEAVFLMGSLGTLAQSSESDLDVWLCHANGLSDKQKDVLMEKCRLIEAWAEEQKVELHVFLMNADDFREGKKQNADEEHSGSSQHLLLLDEFYRSSLWLAGRQPAWWLVPLKREKHSRSYLRQLLDRQLIHETHWIDFGPVATIPPAEFVGAGLWQLNKGLKNPYKSLLKLLLTRHYASQYPKTRPLCWDLKQRIHEGDIDPLSCDSYRLMLKRVSEQVSSEQDQSRLELLRRSFYFKARLPVSKATQGQQRQWRFQELEQLITDWGWSSTELYHLDHREFWRPTEVLSERNALVHEMLTSYRYLAAFTNKHARKVHINRQDLTLLGNQLYAVYDAKPGKLLTINPGIAPSLQQEKISLLLTKKKRWQLIPGTYNREGKNDILKQSSSLIELLCYAHFNGLLNQHTQYAIYPEINSLGKYELKELLQVIRALKKPDVIEPNHFLKPPVPEQWHLFINAGVDPMHQFTRRGMQKLSNRDDALGYSALRENLVQTIDVLSINSWGEWRVQRFHGHQALADTLEHLLQHLPLARKKEWPAWQCHCFCASRPGAIRQRVEQLITDVTSHVIEQPRTDLILEAGSYYYLLQQSKSGITISHAQGAHRFLALLARPRNRYASYKLDQSALLGSPLRPVFSHAKPGAWQIFYWCKDNRYFWYLLDEHGVLLHYQQNAENHHEVLVPVIRFLKMVDQRMMTEQGRRRARPLLLHELVRNHEQAEFEAHPRKLPSLSSNMQNNIQLSAVLDDLNQTTLYCNGHEFSVWEWGESLYPEVAKMLMDLRKTRTPYPAYLTDLTLYNDSGILQHVRYKQKIEKSLNQALEELQTKS